MKLDLIQAQQLVCPPCVRKDPLAIDIVLSLEDPHFEPGAPNEVVRGRLLCPKCGSVYPIVSGIAFFYTASDPGGGQQDMGSGRYRDEAFARGYVQTHFRDVILADTAARSITQLHDPTGFYECFPEETYYPQLAELLDTYLTPNAFALDLGCSVGRLSHELARKARFVIGADRAELHVRIAREIMLKRQIEFRPAESTISGYDPGGPQISLDVSSIVRDNVEFIVADETTLPFRDFDVIACASVIDRVPDAAAFLEGLRRLTRDGSLVLLSTPFDQDEKWIEKRNWLGLGAFGTGKGRAEDALETLAARLHLRLLSRSNLRWVTYKDRRNHYVWSVYAGLFEAAVDIEAQTAPGLP